MLEARNIWDLIVRRTEETPERELAVDETGRRMTFGEYRDRSERVAAGLRPRKTNVWAGADGTKRD